MLYNLKNIMVIILSIIFISSIALAQKRGVWFTTDSLYERRMEHAGTQLDNGNILITGGITPTQNNSSNETELFDVGTLKWSMTVPMNKGRSYHDLIKLKDGSIMAAGGFNENSCEILNNDYTRWIFTDSLKRKRFYGQSTTLMLDGNVLLVGGYTDYPANDSAETLKECELYDYIKGEWTTTGDLNIGRYGHAATLLQDGRILVTGGTTFLKTGTKLLNSSEMFDPITKEWVEVAPMRYSRAGHSATLLSNGKVLVVGGKQNYCELFDLMTNRWEVVGPVYFASGHNRAIILGGEEYLLLVHDYDGYITRAGWELYSLKNYESIYYERFNRIIYDQVVLKIDDTKAIVAGGMEAVFAGGGLVLFPTSFCQIYDINLTGVKENKNDILPNVFPLSSYPNPFNSSTNITVELSFSESISLVVYNTLGEEIGVIYQGNLNAGTHTFRYNMNNYSSGVYFIRMSSPKEARLIKIVHQR